MSPPKRVPAERLDLLLVARGLATSRTRAQALILAGRVRSAEQTLSKPGIRYSVDLPIEVTPGRRYASRGGHKLAHAWDQFEIDSRRETALDVGASTGGFTQVLLEAGFAHVIALDVGRGQLDWTLRNDPRVHVLEGMNARNLTADLLPFRPSLTVIDVSFISLTLILPAVSACLDGNGEIIGLVKPQFEVGRGEVGKGGIVRDPELHRKAVGQIAAFAVRNGWCVQDVSASPLLGAGGNREFLIHIRPFAAPGPSEELESRIATACRPVPRAPQ